MTDFAESTKPATEPKTRIVLDVTTEDPEFVRNLAVTIAAEVRAIVQAKSPNGETSIVVSIQ